MISLATCLGTTILSVCVLVPALEGGGVGRAAPVATIGPHLSLSPVVAGGNTRNWLLSLSLLLVRNDGLVEDGCCCLYVVEVRPRKKQQQVPFETCPPTPQITAFADDDDNAKEGTHFYTHELKTEVLSVSNVDRVILQVRVSSFCEH